MTSPRTTRIRQTAFRGLIGVERFDVTPPEGIYARMWGAALHETAHGLHRPLTGTAIAFGDVHRSRFVTTVSLDLGWWRNPDDEFYVRGYVLERLGIHSTDLIISLTHTHAGPSISRSHSDKPGGHLIEAYVDALRASIAAAVGNAIEMAAPATMAWQYGHCSLAANRHVRSPLGDRVVVGYNPNAAADDTLLVGRIATDDGKVAATIINYACHPTSLGPGNQLISPDYVGAMREVIESHTGGAPCLFLQGASGELAPQQQYAGDISVAERNGRILGYAALSTLESMLPHDTDYELTSVMESGAPLGVWSYEAANASERIETSQTSVSLPLKTTSSAVLPTSNGCDQRVIRERRERSQQLQQLVKDAKELRMSLWVWRLGDCFFVAVPAECYSHLQLHLRAKYPATPIVVLNIANGYCSYLPTMDHYQRAGYEVQVSLLSPGCLEQLIDSVEAAIAKLSVGEPESLGRTATPIATPQHA
jgi:hypothetical protein